MTKFYPDNPQSPPRKIEADSTFTFRVNSDVKTLFTGCCFAESLTPSAALNRYMRKCIAAGKIV